MYTVYPSCYDHEMVCVERFVGHNVIAIFITAGVNLEKRYPR